MNRQVNALESHQVARIVKDKSRSKNWDGGHQDGIMKPCLTDRQESRKVYAIDTELVENASQRFGLFNLKIWSGFAGLADFAGLAALTF